MASTSWIKTYIMSLSRASSIPKLDVCSCAHCAHDHPLGCKSTPWCLLDHQVA